MPEPVVIVALGACTSIGRDAWSSAAAVRAGLNNFGQHPYMIDAAGEPMRVARADWLEIGMSGVERLEALLFPAIDEVMEVAAASCASSLRVGLMLGLPAVRPGLPRGLQRDLVARLGQRCGRCAGAVAAFPAGHAAGLFGLETSFRKLGQGELDVCLAASVDSWMEPETLEWLERCDQLHGAGLRNNAWGFVPGEAGAALLLVRESIREQLELQPLAYVLGVGTALEPKRIKTETVCIGEGLTRAFRLALEAMPPGRKVSEIYCDMNGEPYRADEFGFTALRTKEYFESASDFVAPADCWGDVGAAGGLLLLMLACAAGAKGYAKGQLAFAWSSAEAGERAAVLAATAERRTRRLGARGG